MRKFVCGDKEDKCFEKEERAMMKGTEMTYLRRRKTLVIWTERRWV